MARSYKDFVTGSTVQDLIDAGNPINKIPPNTGLYNTRIARTNFSFNASPGSKVIENQGAYIVLGQVPHSSKASGYGGKGLPADAIDLVVGRGSSMRGGKGPKEDSVVDNNFATDSARIHICRLMDIDTVFGLDSRAGISNGRGLVARSGIGIKADGVRIIGREGVKIVTGKIRGARGFGLFGETNSLGGKISTPAPKIELVAGNNYENVQGICLGESTRDSLRELHELIGEIWSAVFSLAVTQAGFNSVLGVTPIPWHASVAPVVTQQQYSRVMSSLYQTKMSSMVWGWNYLRPSGPNYIVSRNVVSN